MALRVLRALRILPICSAVFYLHISCSLHFWLTSLIWGHQINKTPALRFLTVLFSLPAIDFLIFHFFILSFQLMYIQCIRALRETEPTGYALPTPDLFEGIGSSDVEAGKSEICRADWQAESLAGIEPAVLDGTSLRNLSFCWGGWLDKPIRSTGVASFPWSGDCSCFHYKIPSQHHWDLCLMKSLSFIAWHKKVTTIGINVYVQTVYSSYNFMAVSIPSALP